VDENGRWAGKGIWVGSGGVYIGYFNGGSMNGPRLVITNQGKIKTGLCVDNFWIGEVIVKKHSGGESDYFIKKESEFYDENGKRITEFKRKNIEMF
jgi:hypothetical protein